MFLSAIFPSFKIYDARLHFAGIVPICASLYQLSPIAVKAVRSARVRTSLTNSCLTRPAADSRACRAAGLRGTDNPSIAAVPFCQGFHRLQLEDRPASHQQVKVVGLAEIAEPHVDRHLTPCVRNPEGDFTVVDLRVEQPAQLRCTSKACRMTSYAQTLNASSSIRRISAATQIGMITSLEKKMKERNMAERKINARNEHCISPHVPFCHFPFFQNPRRTASFCRDHAGRAYLCVIVPTVANCCEVAPLGTGQDIVDELVLDPPPPQIHELAVRQVARNR